MMNTFDGKDDIIFIKTENLTFKKIEFELDFDILCCKHWPRSRIWMA